jgi:hypothetical protein
MSAAQQLLLCHGSQLRSSYASVLGECMLAHLWLAACVRM